MGKENICEYFRKDSPCGFANWLIEKPYADIHVPEKGCGCGKNKTEIESCFRKFKGPKIMNEFGPVAEGEHDIALPKKYINSKGEKKRLPGGTHK